MSRSILSSQDRGSLIRLARSLPAGDETRRAVLAGMWKNQEKEQAALQVVLSDIFRGPLNHGAMTRLERLAKDAPAYMILEGIKSWSDDEDNLEDYPQARVVAQAISVAERSVGRIPSGSVYRLEGEARMTANLLDEIFGE